MIAGLYILEEAKDKVQEVTGLRPTNEKLLKGVRALSIPPRIRDHMRNMLTGKIKCGNFWNKVSGHTERAFCPFCKKKCNTEVIETEEHMWMDYENSGQAWRQTAENIWRKSTKRDWPAITLGLIRGAAALTFEGDIRKDSERFLMSMTIWVIWKSKLKISIHNQDVAPSETTQILRELITYLLRKSWNATRFMRDDRNATRQRALRT